MCLPPSSRQSPASQGHGPPHLTCAPGPAPPRGLAGFYQPPDTFAPDRAAAGAQGQWSGAQDTRSPLRAEWTALSVRSLSSPPPLPLPGPTYSSQSSRAASCLVVHKCGPGAGVTVGHWGRRDPTLPLTGRSVRRLPLGAPGVAGAPPGLGGISEARREGVQLRAGYRARPGSPGGAPPSPGFQLVPRGPALRPPPAAPVPAPTTQRGGPRTGPRSRLLPASGSLSPSPHGAEGRALRPRPALGSVAGEEGGTARVP